MLPVLAQAEQAAQGGDTGLGGDRGRDTEQLHPPLTAAF